MRVKRLAVLLAVFFSAALVAAQQASAGGPSGAKNILRVSGPRHEPIDLSEADLRGMAHVLVTIHNPHTNADEIYVGVRLAEVLAKIKVPLGSDLHGEALANYVVATGSDGYKAVFSLAEADPSFHPGDVIVADAMDGKPLDAHSGPFRLVVTEDKRPARCVRNLVSIELKAAQ